MSIDRSVPRGAVFLSYASQDADAARRLCDALRAAGVEVWFDQNELVGGDAWDAKIRKQIAECALFAPIISANTQARREGYFRIEWRLAAQRTHAMADGTPFLLPLVIDGTRDTEALVPTEFKAVQWTRLRPAGYGGQARPQEGGYGGQARPAGEREPEDPAIAALVVRVQRLLASSDSAAGVGTVAGVGPGAGVADSEDRAVDIPIRPASTRPAGASAGPAPARAGRRWLAVAGVALVVCAALAFWLTRRDAPPGAAVSSGAPAAVTEAATFPRDPELRRAWTFLHSAENVEDLKLAEEIVKAVLARRAADPEAVLVYAWVNNAYLNRGFDRSEERFVLGRRYAEQAVKLAPEEPEALASLGQFLAFRRADLPRAEQLLRRAIELRPGEPRFYRALSYNVLRDLRPDEAMQLAERSVQLFPNEPLVWYEFALHCRDVGRIDEMERALDRCLGLAPINGAVLWKAWFSVWLRGDLAGMKHWLERLPAGARNTDRALAMLHQLALLSRQPADLGEALRALHAFPGNTLEDFFYAGPKALLIGDLLAAQGQTELARRQYEVALAEIARAKAAAPTSVPVLTAELWTLLGLGRREEALVVARLLIAAQGERPRRFVFWWQSAARAGLLLGARDLALPLLRRDAGSDKLRAELRVALRIDPAMEPFRADPEIAALLADPPAAGSAPATPGTPPSGPVPAKSIAVLAFKNLSDDRAQEYFSDGLSEELSNALGRVPGLFVLGSTSAFSVKGQALAVPEIARKLGVAYVVEGTVRPAGPSVRVSARLLNGADGLQLWSSGNLDREVRNSLALQEELAGLIAQQLSLKLGAAPAAAVAAVDPEAYRLYLEGLQAWSRRSGVAGEDEEVLRAQGLFGRALALAPDFARAQAAFADTWVMLFDGRYRNFAPDAAELGQRARREVERALVLGAELGEVQATHARLLLAERRYEEAAVAFQRAIRVNPNYAYARQWYGRLLCNRGRLEEGLAEMKVATQLDPLSPIVTSNYALYLSMARRWPEVLPATDRVLALAPDYRQAVLARAQALLSLSRVEEARVLLRADATRGQSLAGNLRNLTSRLLAGERGELVPEAEARLAKPDALRLTDAVRLALALGRTEDAFRLARERPRDWRVDSALYFFYPGYDGVREDPRFRQWLEDAGCRREYEQAWAEHEAWRRRTGAP